jgi:hypothetical protein
MDDLSRLPPINGQTIIRGTFKVMPYGELLASPFSGARAVVFRWHFCNVESLDIDPAAHLGLAGAVLSASGDGHNRVERPITTVDRRAPFVLLDGAGQSVLVRETVAIMGLQLAVPPTPQPAPRFPIELAGVEQAARAMIGEPCYRECFLLPDTVVEVDMLVQKMAYQAPSGYRDAPTAIFEAVAMKHLVEVEEDAAGLPVTASIGKRIGRWFSRLVR